MKQTQSLQFAALALCAFAAQADQIILKNGDKISGTIVNKSGKTVQIQSDYAGSSPMSINWDAVDSINSDKPLAIIMKDRREVAGLATAGENGTMTIKNNGTYDSQPIPVADVDEINHKFFSGSTNFGGGLSTGNTERQNYHGDANVIVQTMDDRVTLGGQYNYGDNTENPNGANKRNVLTARNWQIYGNYAHFFNPKWYGYATGLFTNDRMQDIQLRTAFGVGIGYQFFKSDDLNLSLEAGPDYLNVNFYDHPFDCGRFGTCGTTLKDRSGVAGRWAVNYNQWFFNHAVQGFHTHEGIVSSDLFIRSRTGFIVPIWRGIQFTNEVQVDYLSKPAPGKQNTDVRYMFNIGYAF